MSNDPSSRLGRDTSQLDEKGPDSEGRKFKDWFQEYMGVDGNSLRKESESIQAVISDELDQDFIEQRIQEGAPKSLTTERFCAECKSLFDNWPTIGGSSTREHDSKPEPGGWEHAVARSCTTFELEGSTRSGCRFCAFLLQSLKDNKMLETFRKLESRLYHLNENAMSSLSIQNWGGNPIQILWVNFPGKVCTHCNSGIAGELKFNSAFLPDTGLSTHIRDSYKADNLKLIVMMNPTMYSISPASGCQLAQKAMNYARSMTRVLYRRGWSQ